MRLMYRLLEQTLDDDGKNQTEKQKEDCGQPAGIDCLGNDEHTDDAGDGDKYKPIQRFAQIRLTASDAVNKRASDQGKDT